MAKHERKSAFRSGFAVGFASPFLIFAPRSARFSYQKYDVVKAAWREVGNALAAATDIEGENVGKTTIKDRKVASH